MTNSVLDAAVVYNGIDLRAGELYIAGAASDVHRITYEHTDIHLGVKDSDVAVTLGVSDTCSVIAFGVDADLGRAYPGIDTSADSADTGLLSGTHLDRDLAAVYQDTSLTFGEYSKTYSLSAGA